MLLIVFIVNLNTLKFSFPCSVERCKCKKCCNKTPNNFKKKDRTFSKTLDW